MIFATNNKGKLLEVKQILNNFNIKGLKEANIEIDVEEDGKTFYENALKKAIEIYNLTKEPVIADDSGLCVISLNNWPGVLTHRFLGQNASDFDRNIQIIKEVNEKSANRAAKVVCCFVYYDGTNVIHTTGEIFGKITNLPRGNNGFGFDPIFELEQGKTLAELSAEEKNKISARALACEKMAKKLNDLTK